MKTRNVMALTALAGMGLGAAAMQGLHAQAKPPVYLVGLIDVSNEDGYGKEYAPKAQAIIKDAGLRLRRVFFAVAVFIADIDEADEINGRLRLGVKPLHRRGAKTHTRESRQCHYVARFH